MVGERESLQKSWIGDLSILAVRLESLEFLWNRPRVAADFGGEYAGFEEVLRSCTSLQFSDQKCCGKGIARTHGVDHFGRDSSLHAEVVSRQQQCTLTSPRHNDHFELAEFHQAP